jgi:hypothetical protein
MKAAPALAKASTDHQLLLAHGNELAAVRLRRIHGNQRPPAAS